MRKYSFILIDEVHDRSIQTDTALFYLKRFMKRNWQLDTCPILILMSATIEPAIFMNYFECPKEHFIEVKGFSNPIDNIFSKYQLSDYISYAVSMAEKTHIENLKDIDENVTVRDILIFVQGNKDAKAIIDKLHLFNSSIMSKSHNEYQVYNKTLNEKIENNKIDNNRNTKKGGGEKEYYICPVLITSDTYKEGGIDYKNLFSEIETLTVPIYENKIITKYVKPTRKIIVGTNVVETGLTIPTLKYCIDTGFAKVNEFNPNFGISLFINKPITRDSAMQRRGRVGRKTSGIWYPCYTQEIFDNMINMSFPQIISSELTEMLLALIISETETEIRLATRDEIKNNTEVFQMNEFDQEKYIMVSNKAFNSHEMNFIQFPPSDSITYSIEKLYGLGFINYDYSPTLFGYYGSKIRKVKIENIRFILAGYSHGANIMDLITIVAMLEAKFKLKMNKYKPRDLLGLNSKENYYYYKFIFADDFIEYLLIWYEFMDLLNMYQHSFGSNKKKSLTEIDEWAVKNGFNIKELYTIADLRDEIIENFLILGLNPYYNGLNLPKGTYNLISIMKRNLHEGYEELIKIKKCLYDGYRYNLAVFIPTLNKYITKHKHIPVELETKLIRMDKTAPMYILLGKIEMKESNKNKGSYEFIGSMISILDGYVDIDLEYTD
jgi:hypothetical protein